MSNVLIEYIYNKNNYQECVSLQTHFKNMTYKFNAIEFASNIHSLNERNIIIYKLPQILITFEKLNLTYYYYDEYNAKNIIEFIEDLNK